MLAFVDGIHFKNRIAIPLPNDKISIYEVTNMPSIICERFINYEMKTPKSCHDMTTPMET